MKSPLPVVEGVAPSCQRLPPGEWKTVLEFFLARFPNVEAETWLGRMAKGEVVDETGARIDSESPYRAGICVFYYREPKREPLIPFEETIIYRDEHIIVADKPHFLPVVPAGRFLRETLLVRLKKKLNLDDLVPCHRIDRETAGLVLFSVNPATRGAYVSLFNERRVEKVYEAIAAFRADLKFPLKRLSRIVAGEPFFRMKEAAGEPNAETLIDFLRQTEGGARYRLIPATGKKHQLRLHLAALGIPIQNDRLYPEINRERAEDFSRPLKLLAKSISFRDPVNGALRRFESERLI